MTHLLHNWKKIASQQLPEEEIEQAFMNQAFGFIQNKAGRLLTDPHRLGFEIVYRNDTNTRIVGIFAFRSGSNLLYAPCFFVNGEVKGTDLLYDHSKKQFGPLTEEWVEFKLETNSPDQGRPYRDPRGDRRSLDMHRLMVPPTGRGYDKVASEIKDLPTFDTIWADMQKEAKVGPILEQFIREDGGVEAIQWIGKAASQSMSFAKALSTLDPDTYAPFGVKSITKQAQAKEPGKLMFWRGLVPGLKSASETLVKYGFALTDSRSDLTPVETYEVNLESISTPGAYNVLLGDGSSAKAQVLIGSETSDCEKTVGWDLYGDPGQSDGDRTEFAKTLIFEDGRVSRTSEPVFGEELEEELGSDQIPSSGLYIALCPEGGDFCIVRVLGKRTRDSVQYIRVRYYDYGDDQEIVLNTEMENAPTTTEGTWYVPSMRWFKLNPEGTTGYKQYRPEKGPNPGDEQCLDRFMTAHQFIPASIREKKAHAREQRFELEVDGIWTEDMDFRSTVLKVAKDLKVGADQALALVEKSAAEGLARFWLDGKALIKNGTMRIIQDPSFSDQYDSEMNVPYETPEGFALDVDMPQEPFPDQRYGDADNPEGFEPGTDHLPQDLIMSETPEALAQLAKMQQLPNVFEHGIVGTLANTRDVGAMVGRYIPDLQKALDSLGRTLFLFYWKPGEFQDAYGVDEMRNMEDELLSNFKTLGDLTLSLLKKSPYSQGLDHQTSTITTSG